MKLEEYLITKLVARNDKKKESTLKVKKVFKNRSKGAGKKDARRR
jgi:hypothetical protein